MLNATSFLAQSNFKCLQSDIGTTCYDRWITLTMTIPNARRKFEAHGLFDSVHSHGL